MNSNRTLRELGGFDFIKKGQFYKFKDDKRIDVEQIYISSDLFVDMCGNNSYKVVLKYKNGRSIESTWSDGVFCGVQDDIVEVETKADQEQTTKSRCYCYDFKIIPLFVSYIKICKNCEKDNGNATKEEYYKFLKENKK